MELKIDRGLKSYEVTDADGAPLGTIYINPADVGIVARLEEAGNAIQKLADGLTDDAQISDVVDADQAIKAQVDYIFGSKASDVFFNGISALALLPDGTMVFEKVLQAIVPLIQDAVEDAIKASQKRVQTRTAVYADKTKGLAPGQKA